MFAAERRPGLAGGLDGHTGYFKTVHHLLLTANAFVKGNNMKPLSSRERFTLALIIRNQTGFPSTSVRSPRRFALSMPTTPEVHLNLAVDKKIRHFADEHIIPDEEIIQALHVDTWYLRMNVPKSWKRERLDAHTVVDEWSVPWSKAPGSLYTFPVSYPIKEAGMEEIEIFSVARSR